MISSWDTVTSAVPTPSCISPLCWPPTRAMYPRRAEAAANFAHALDRTANWELGGCADKGKTIVLPHVRLVAVLHRHRALAWHQILQDLRMQACALPSCLCTVCCLTLLGHGLALSCRACNCQCSPPEQCNRNACKLFLGNRVPYMHRALASYPAEVHLT